MTTMTITTTKVWLYISLAMANTVTVPYDNVRHTETMSFIVAVIYLYL
jgi:hypothetical protein